MPGMFGRILRAARFEREAYLHAVVGQNAVADGLMVVAAVWVVLAVVVAGDFDVVLYLRWVLNGLFAWIVLSGVIYLLGKYVFEGYGSFPGTMAMSALCHPTLLLILVTRVWLSGFWAILAGTGWFLATLVAGSRVALDLPTERAALSVGGGLVVWLVVVGIL
jgi:hypothetical protein